MRGLSLAALSLLVMCVPAYAKNSEEQKPSEHWTYIKIDGDRAKWGDWNSPRWLRYFGFDARDIDGDGFEDIVSGRYLYRNPGGDMSGPWERIDFGLNLDGALFVDVDHDEFPDVIGQALPYVYWLESDDPFGKTWQAHRVAELPPTKHVNSQGYMKAQIIPGAKPELLFATSEGIFCIEIPKQPIGTEWKKVRVTSGTMDEGIGVGDINGDGYQDIVSATEHEENESYSLMWYANPGDGSADWKGVLVSRDTLTPDRIVLADFNGDQLVDIAVSEERFPPKEHGDAGVYWFEHPRDLGAHNGGWKKHPLGAGHSFNSLDTGDLDNDGDADIVTNEMEGEKRLLAYINDGRGQFTERPIDTGKEMHLGARCFDLDKDGDTDIAGPSWGDYKRLHLWRNNAMSNPPVAKWSRISSAVHLRDLPTASVGWQSSALAADLDKDGTDDIVIAGWSYPSMVWLKKKGKRWQWRLIDNRNSHAEAGGTTWDIDGDGDLDILQGGSWNTNEVWWWENPYPDYDALTPWNRYTIKDYGQRQHHDQIFGDFDHDGADELVLWNQKAKQLLIADIPKDPRVKGDWKFEEVWSWSNSTKYEGLAKADVDLDGKIDLVAGGFWFKHEYGSQFTANLIDDYGLSRSAVGDLIEGGRPEVILSSGDSVNTLNMYEWNGRAWKKTVLIAPLVHGHTLCVADVNKDGHLDIYTAEMKDPGAGEDCRQFVLYGDGKGKFTVQVVSVGSGTHEGKLGDLDGDGDLDILQKGFKSQDISVWLQD